MACRRRSRTFWCAYKCSTAAIRPGSFDSPARAARARSIIEGIAADADAILRVVDERVKTSTDDDIIAQRARNILGRVQNFDTFTKNDGGFRARGMVSKMKKFSLYIGAFIGGMVGVVVARLILAAIFGR